MALHNNRWTVGKVGNIDTGINSSLGHGGGEKSQEERGNITITEILLISQSPQEEVEHLSLLMLLFVGVPCETSPFSSRERWHGKVTSSVFSFLFFFFVLGGGEFWISRFLMANLSRDWRNETKWKTSVTGW